MCSFPYTSSNLLRTFQVSFRLNYLAGSFPTGYSTRKVCFNTIKMFDASEINNLFNVYSTGSRILSGNAFCFLNSLLPYTLKDSDSHSELDDILSSNIYISYISNFSIHTLQIF